jgi:hypothetical protein
MGKWVFLRMVKAMAFLGNRLILCLCQVLIVSLLFSFDFFASDVEPLLKLHRG